MVVNYICFIQADQQILRSLRRSWFNDAADYLIAQEQYRIDRNQMQCICSNDNEPVQSLYLMSYSTGADTLNQHQLCNRSYKSVEICFSVQNTESVLQLYMYILTRTLVLVGNYDHQHKRLSTKPNNFTMYGCYLTRLYIMTPHFP